MTNNGIKTRDVLMALHQDNFEWVNKNEFVRITYRDFVRACHQIDIADPRVSAWLSVSGVTVEQVKEAMIAQEK